MQVRKRITIDNEIYNAAVEYAVLDKRTFTGLIEESLTQMMRRYPRKPIEYNHERLSTLEMLTQNIVEENKEIRAEMARLRSNGHLTI